MTCAFTVAVQQAEETTELVEEPGAVFDELVEDFADALDTWSQTVKGALNGRPQKVLVNGLNVNQGKVSRWLSGREQIWKGQAALPGAGLTQDIVRVLQLHGPRVDLLMQMADRVDQLQKQLMEHKGWRKKAGDRLRSGLEVEAPSNSAMAEAPSTSRRNRQRRSWRDQPRRVKTSFVGALAVAIAAMAVIVTAAVVGPDGDEKAGNGPEGAGPQSSASASQGSSAQKGPGVVLSESPGLEKGALGEDSRCSVPFAGPGAMAWRVCARVEAERVAFALKITNHGSKAATVKIRLEYVQANEFHPCPKAPSTHLLDVAAGETVTTDLRQCTVTREETPFAYQGVGWLLAEDVNVGSYKLSPTANVYPDRVTWQPDLV
ncbi:hypothetical protein [Streptomyces mirabilis]|uniref:hypothetical protein n=1 Tax=Streptomyces mirabilis TaxID=68239 RepID=UPI0036EC7B1C